MSFSTLLDKFIKQSSETNASIAQKLTAMGRKISKESIAKYRQGARTPDPDTIEMLCSILGILEQDLFVSAYEKKEKIALEMLKTPTARLKEALQQYAPSCGEEAEEIPIFEDAVAGAGSEAFYPEYLHQNSKAIISRQFLGGVNPKYLMFFQIVGDSMEPTLRINDWVLIELVADREFYPVSGIYLIDMDGGEQGIDIISDNQNFPVKNSIRDHINVKVIGKLFLHMKNYGALSLVSMQ